MVEPNKSKQKQHEFATSASGTNAFLRPMCSSQLGRQHTLANARGPAHFNWRNSAECCFVFPMKLFGHYSSFHSLRILAEKSLPRTSAAHVVHRLLPQTFRGALFTRLASASICAERIKSVQESNVLPGLMQPV